MKQKNRKPAIKEVKQIVKFENKSYYELIREFFDGNIDIDNSEQVTEVLNAIHLANYNNVVDHKFTLVYKKHVKPNNVSYFCHYPETDKQKLYLANDWKTDAPELLKKTRTIDGLFHEEKHKVQCDLSLVAEYVKLNEFEKCVCLEYETTSLIPYALQLREIEARMEATKGVLDLIKRGIIEPNEQTLFSALFNIDDILFSFNRGNIKNGEIEFDLDKFMSRYMTSLKLQFLIDDEENEYEFLNSESFKIKLRMILKDKLEDFKKDIALVYAYLMQCYKPSNKIKIALNLDTISQLKLMSEAKKFIYNDYYLHLMFEDLYDRFYKTQSAQKIDLNTRKSFIFEKDKEDEK